MDILLRLGRLQSYCPMEQNVRIYLRAGAGRRARSSSGNPRGPFRSPGSAAAAHAANMRMAKVVKRERQDIASLSNRAQLIKIGLDSRNISLID